MKILKALFYQYYWWQMRREKDEFFVPILAVLCVLIPLFGIVGFIAIFADVTGLIALKIFDIKMVIFSMFILGLAIFWWLKPDVKSGVCFLETIDFEIINEYIR